MKLLDAANVNPPEPRLMNNQWLRGYNAVARSCAAHIEIEDACYLDGNTAVMGDVNSNPGTYPVVPFAIRAFIRNGVSCQQDDDDKWLREALPTKLNYILTRSLVAQMDPGVVSWVGGAGAQSVTLAGTTAAQLRTGVALGLDLWESTILDPEGPIMHVPASLVGDMAGAGLLISTGPREVSSPLVDKVVVSAGYDIASPHIFFTGEIKIRLTDVDDEGGPLYQPRLNNYTVSTNQFAAVDLPPCSIVRVGA